MFSILKKDLESIDLETFLEKVAAVVGLNNLEAAISDLDDRRILLESLAQRLKIDENNLIKKVAKKLGLPAIDNIRPLDFRNLVEPLKISELRQYGIMPIANENQVVGYVCCDPSLLPEKYWLLVKSGGALSSWKKISEALEASEKLSIPSPGNDILDCEEALNLLVLQAENYGARNVKIIAEQEQLVYEFKTKDGQFGRGTIAPVIRSPLLEILNSSLKNTEHELILKDRAPLYIERTGASYVIQFEKAQPQLAEKDDFVLLVDGDPLFLRVLNRYLSKKELTLKVASSKVEAEKYLKQDPGLIICSTKIADESGTDFIKEIKAMPQYKDLPIIALIEDRDIEMQLSALTAGAGACVSKNDNPRVLYAYLEKMMQKKAPLIKVEGDNNTQNSEMI